MRTNIMIKTYSGSSPSYPDINLCEKLSDMQKEVWGLCDRDALPPWKLFVMPRTGSHLIVAFDGDRPVGHGVFTHAVESNSEATYLYLDMLGVLKEYRSQDLGRRILNQAQLVAQEHGYKFIKWTYDPLEGVNASLYIRRMGAVAVEYHPNFFGNLSGDRHQGSPADRFLACLLPDGKPADGAEPQVTISMDAYDTYPSVILDVPARVAVEIPYDFQEILKSHPDRAQSVRLETSRIFQNLLERGYLIDGFDRHDKRNFYVASHRPK